MRCRRRRRQYRGTMLLLTILLGAALSTPAVSAKALANNYNTSGGRVVRLIAKKKPAPKKKTLGSTFSSLMSRLTSGGDWIREMARTVSSRSETPSQLLVDVLSAADSDEQRVVAFVRSHPDCSRIFIDVGEDAYRMLASVNVPPPHLNGGAVRASLEATRGDPAAALSQAKMRMVLIQTLDRFGPHISARCDVCTILVPSTPVDASDSNSTLLLTKLRARGMAVLVVAGAGVGPGVQEQPHLRRLTDLAALVHTVARSAQRSVRLVMRLDAGIAHNVVLISHLLASQALCRLRALLVAWPTGGKFTISPRGDGISLADRSSGQAESEWMHWTRFSLRSALLPPHTMGGCVTSLTAVPAAADMRPPPTLLAPGKMAQLFPVCTGAGITVGETGAARGSGSSSSRSDRTGSSDSRSDSTSSDSTSSTSRATTDARALAADAADDLARVDALFTRHGCVHAYLDVGTNIGVQIRKLYEPHKYPGVRTTPTAPQP